MKHAEPSEGDQWTLTLEERELVISKHHRTRLSFATLLVFFRDRGRFPRHEPEVDPQGIAALSRQIDAFIPVDDKILLATRTAERMRSEIRTRFGFREASVADVEPLTQWLQDQAVAEVGAEIEAMIERLEARCRELSIEPPTAERAQRIVRAALRAHEEQFHSEIYQRLTSKSRERLDELLEPAKDTNDHSMDKNDSGSKPAVLLKLRGNPGRPSLASMKEELAKLDLIRRIDLPADLFDDVSPRELERYRRRVEVRPTFVINQTLI